MTESDITSIPGEADIRMMMARQCARRKELRDRGKLKKLNDEEIDAHPQHCPIDQPRHGAPVFSSSPA